MSTPATDEQAATARVADPILSAHNLVKHFPIRSSGLIRRQIGVVHAVCDVSFELGRGETLGLVGESGCGKSTTARLVLNLIKATSGEVRYAGRELTSLPAREMRTLRQDLQIVFQDPYASLDPRMPINEVVAEPLRIHGRYDQGGRELLFEVGQLDEYYDEHRELVEAALRFAREGLRDGGVDQVLITGHSLGGILAEEAGARAG